MAWWNRGRTPTDGTDPHLAPFTAAAKAAIAADVSRAVLLRRPSDPEPCPTTGPERDAWIGRQVAGAFRTRVARSVYRFDEALEEAVADHLRSPERISTLLDGTEDVHTRNDREALIIAARYASLARGGGASLARIEAETEELCRAPDAAVTARLHGTPPARMDALPADEARRRLWLGEMLTGEAAAISTGAMPPGHVARAAVHGRFPVSHDRPADGSPVEVRFPAYHPEGGRDAQRIAQAETLAHQDDQRLLSRFGGIPGCTTPPADRARRVSWTRRALTAEAVRRAAGLDARPSSLALDLVDIETALEGDLLSFSGQLVLSGERICRITSPGGGEISADAWAEGCGPQDLEALDLVLSATGDPRDDGVTPDSLGARLMDRVAMHLALESYREAAARAVVFTVEEDGLPVVLTVPIPEGGTRDGARAAMRAAHPDAVALDEMQDDDAALLWAALS